MSRTYVVTGSASGIGKKTAELLSSRGAKVIGATMNTTGSFTFRATKVGAETALAQIIV